MRLAIISTVVAALMLGACAPGETADTEGVLVVTTSTIVEDIVSRIAGDDVDVVSVIPNGFDSHTYEPRPSEIELLGDADLIVLADETLNSGITQLAVLSGDPGRILDLNAEGLAADDLIRRNSGSGWNPHTWTDPTLVAKWLPPLAERLTDLLGDDKGLGGRVTGYAAELDALDARIEQAFSTVPATDRKLVVYHDAWEYFGRRYGLDVVGALQAVNFAEPSATELTRMAEQIRAEQVPAFFGSEVFPSDVLEVLERESGARYIADLADDRLNGTEGSAEYGYIPLMDANLALLLEGLRR